MSGPQSVDPGLLLFQLRRAQSFWYQELYQAESTPLPDPTSYAWQMCLEMREWGDSLPPTLSPDIRRMFEEELRYSYVYCISPSSRAPQITEYSRILIFEYAIAYLDEMHEISHNAFDSAYYTYHDALKVYFMASQLLAVLRDAEDTVLSGASIPVPISPPGCPPAPPIPKRVGQSGDNIARALLTLERVPRTLAKYSERWDESTMLKISLEKMAAEVIERLKLRQQMPGLPMGQQQQQQQQQLMYTNNVPGIAQGQNRTSPLRGEMRWVDVDPSQMMRGAGQ